MNLGRMVLSLVVIECTRVYVKMAKSKLRREHRLERA